MANQSNGNGQAEEPEEGPQAYIGPSILEQELAAAAKPTEPAPEAEESTEEDEE